MDYVAEPFRSVLTPCVFACINKAVVRAPSFQGLSRQSRRSAIRLLATECDSIARRTMPYSNNRGAEIGRTTATPTVSARSKQTVYTTPRLAKTPSTDSPLDRDNQTRSSPKWTIQKSLTENDATPIKPVLSANVTPRSSSRRSRVRSTSSAANGTPSEAEPSPRPKSMVIGNESGPRGPVKPRVRTTAEPRAHIRSGSLTSTTSSPSVMGNRKSPQQGRFTPTQASSPTFFRADESKTFFGSKTTAKPTHEPTGKGSTFFYANGTEEFAPLKPAVKSGPRLAQSPESATRKAVDAVKKQSPQARSSWSSPASIASRTGPGARARSTSPLKVSATPRDSSGKSGAVADLKASPPAREPGGRRASKSSSVAATQPERSLLDQGPQQLVERLLSNAVDKSPRGPATPRLSDASDPKSSPPREPPRDVGVSPDQAQKSSQSPQSPITSPLRLAPVGTDAESRVAKAQALAADARRERKVLDLEISNSSLLAINRTLEREMRKQTAELRRFRRLTSAGRLSLAPSKRSISSGFSVNTDLTEMSEEDSEDHDAGFSSENEDEDLDDADPTQSPSTLAIKRAQQRSRDEKRIQLDLAKHQELLVDSQRMNQSIKRCLGWTEDLISEGRKALAHRIRVSDVQLGGRVLEPDGLGGDQSRRHGLLSPAVEETEPEWGIVEDPDPPEPQNEVQDQELPGSTSTSQLQDLGAVD